MAAPTFKFQSLFEYGKEGWSEEWWTQAADYTSLEKVALAYAQMRYNMTAQGVSVIGARLVNTAAKRTGYAVVYPQFVSSSTSSGPTSQVSQAWLLRLRSADNLGKRNFYMRGENPPLIDTPIVGDRFLPAPLVIQHGKTITKFCSDNGLVVRTAGHLDDVGAVKVQITALLADTNGYLKVVGTGLAALLPTPPAVQVPLIISGLTGLASKFNRTWGPAEIQAVPPDGLVFKAPVSSAALQSQNWLNAWVRKTAYDGKLLTQGSIEFLSDKNTGRAFFVPRGRRRTNS